MTPDERWLVTMWPFVRGWLPAPPAAVVEIGCGPLGGFVPMLRSAGYDASGVDPEAPEGPWYHRVEFERHEMPGPAAALVACASLHHVADVGEVLGLAGSALADGGMLVVVEWAWERFDAATARWCFDRLPASAAEHSWLRHRHDEWRASGCPGKAISGPGRQRRACTRARTSCANWTPGSTASSSVTGPIFFPTWPA
jgi:hypothetical protein